MNIPSSCFESVQHLALKLFSHVYTGDVTAALYVSEQDELLDVRLFDTTFGADVLKEPVPHGTAKAVLLVNQPEGLRALSKTDKLNVRRLRIHTRTATSVYRVCELECVRG